MPAGPSPGGGATETCAFTSPSALVAPTVPASVVSTPSQLARMLAQVQAAPGAGSAFALSFDLVQVDVN
jgi:hypothetical protein